MELGQPLGLVTNNQAELEAVRLGLVGLREPEKTAVRLYSDSSYVLGVVSGRMSAKANVALVRAIRNLLDRLGWVEFIKVAGHRGVVENEQCDSLARKAARSGRVFRHGPVKT